MSSSRGNNNDNDTSMGDVFRQRRNNAAKKPTPVAATSSINSKNNGSLTVAEKLLLSPKAAETTTTTTTTTNNKPPSFAEIQAEQQQQQQQQDRRRPQQQSQSQNNRRDNSMNRGSAFDRDTSRGSSSGGGGFDRDNSNHRANGGGVGGGGYDRDTNRSGGGYDRGNSFGGGSGGRRGGSGGRNQQEDRSNLPIEQGVICSIKDSFGFIYCADREEELFFHFSQVQNCHPDELIMDDELEFRVGDSKGKTAAFELVRLDRGTIVFETEDEPGHLFQGVVEKPLRMDRSGNVTQDGVIRLLEKATDADADVDANAATKEAATAAAADNAPIVAATGAMVRFTQHDYVPNAAATADAASEQESGGRFRRSNSTASNASASRGGGGGRNGGGGSLGLGTNDLVEFTLVTSRRNQVKYARSIKLLQSDRDRQRFLKEEKMLANAVLERGIVTTLKNDFGFLRSNKRREEVYFHYSNVELDNDDGTEEQELKIGNSMEFLVVAEEGGGRNNNSKEKISARQVKFLPHGSVEFQTILATGVTGIVTRCPHPADAGYSSDMVGTVRLSSSIKDTNDDGTERVVEEIAFYSSDAPGGNFSVREGTVGLWVRRGDTLMFDVAKETIDGSLRVFPTKKQVGDVEVSEAEATPVASVKLVSCGLALRTEGTVHAMKDTFGFIHCAERPVDAYFRFYEQFPEELRLDLLHGMGIKDTAISFGLGTEVQFDLSVQRPTGQVRQRPQRGGATESLKCQRVLLLPKGTIVQSKIVAMGVKGVVDKEDAKQPYAGSIELEIEQKSMVFEERHPLIAKLILSLLESDGSKSFIFPDIQSVKEDNVVLEAVETLGKGLLHCSNLPTAGQGKNGGRLCIVRGGDEAKPGVILSEEQTNENEVIGDNAQAEAGEGSSEKKSTDGTSKKKGRKKKKPKGKALKLVRYDKHSFGADLIGGIPPASGDQILCDIIQSRRTGLVQLTNVRIIERKNPDAVAEASSLSAWKESGNGVVSEIVSARQFGFISVLDEGSTKREVMFFHFRNVIKNESRNDDLSDKVGKGLGVKKGDEVNFSIATQEGGKRTATKIEILPSGTLDILSKPSKNACHGFVLMEPSHSSLKDTPDRHGRSPPDSVSQTRGGLSPKRGEGGGGRWDKVDLNDGKARNKMAKAEGRILLTKDPTKMFSARQEETKALVQHMSSVDSDAIDERIQTQTEGDAVPECAICTHLGYKSGGIAIHGAGATSVADSTSNKGPRRGDLVSFVKAKSGGGIRDVRVVTKGAATLIRGRLEQIAVDSEVPSLGTAVFVAATEKEQRYTIELKEIVSCDVSVLKENETVEGLLHEEKVFGVCRTKDLFLESKLGLSHKERPKLNLTVRKGLGGKIMAQTMMAKGPDGTNGFASGWTPRVSQQQPVAVEGEDS